MMKITLKEPGSGSFLELEVYKMDTSIGIGWSVVLPKGKNVLIKFNNGEWETDEGNNMSHEFWQTVGNEINLLLEEERMTLNATRSHKALVPRPKRTRMLKYLLI
ncbi:hypothetical protein [Mucilaginibacter flavidus]|uniref:hypothetical protein n=1 Tax=Mucilaginibacter flavidus TaxID=2949309 RepID=UPI0020927616|nr:hypothetical protein [Mucilaginibacter flavidus]MCO5948632.1 hypothetical protein [Mucilaginibacter flavidus]